MDIKLTSSVLLELTMPDADSSKASRTYQLSVPSWASYVECRAVCDAFKLGFEDMEAKNKEAAEKLKSESSDVDSNSKGEADGVSK